jgi:hypothetical protein
MSLSFWHYGHISPDIGAGARSADPTHHTPRALVHAQQSSAAGASRRWTHGSAPRLDTAVRQRASARARARRRLRRSTACHEPPPPLAREAQPLLARAVVQAAVRAVARAPQLPQPCGVLETALQATPVWRARVMRGGSSTFGATHGGSAVDMAAIASRGVASPAPLVTALAPPPSREASRKGKA